MILDTIQNAARYADVANGLREILAAQKDYSVFPYQPARTDIDGDRSFLLANEYDTKPLDKDALMEAHQKYLDVMYMVEGEELIYVKPTDRLQHITKPYDASIEALLAKVDDDCTVVRLQAGQFIVLFPEDAHCPARQAGTQTHVKKIIGKLMIQE